MARKKKTMDGNTAAAHVAYAFTDVAGIYPITPSSVMAELSDKWAAEGQKNIFGQTVKVVEMQSEAGAAGVVHGSLAAGALTTTFTASQGLLLMIPNMYKIAGELLPGVIHVSARAVASHALNIFGDHSDVMACRATGFAMLAASNPQEVMDLGAVAHLSAIKGRIPFLHFFDGFRTSHEQQKIEIWDYDELAKLVDYDAVDRFRANSLNPEHPVLRGSAQNGDIFFQARESCNTYYDELPSVVEEYMNRVNAEIGTDYKLFNYYGAPDAEHVIVAMGSVCDTIEETIDYLAKQGEKVGLLKVRLYRPFATAKFVEALPKSCKAISVLDRTKEPGSQGEPLYLDVITALRENGIDGISVYGGRYGLGSKDTPPSNIIAVYRNMQSSAPKKEFTIGITDDVTNLSLPSAENPNTTPEGIISCKFWGLGSDGTVGANKNAIKIIGDHTDMNAQAYFFYDSKKSGGITVSHLRFGNQPIKSTYYISQADFVACHNPSYIGKYDMVQDVRKGGTFLINAPWTDADISSHLPAKDKKYIADNDIKVYVVDGIKIAKELGLGGRINMILMSAFFCLTKILPIDDAVEYMRNAVVASYGKRGEAVVNMNYAAIDAGKDAVHAIKVPADWSNPGADEAAEAVTGDRQTLVDFVTNVMNPVNAQRGDRLPVSAFKGAEDGTFPQGSSAYEKRGIAVDVPKWIPENCIQCNQCSFVCPHAVIRPFAATEDEVKAAPAGYQSKKMIGKGLDAYQYSIVVSTYDCTGCGACANTCPAKTKALEMVPLETMTGMQEVFNYAFEKLSDKPEIYDAFKVDSVKGSQFKQPLLEFSGACAGCVETAYAKLITQLFGDRMLIANATGCSSIWGGSAPSTPYTVNREGKGPAWANSLFEDNAEYGYGMFLGMGQRRTRLIDTVSKLVEVPYCDSALVEAGKAWLENAFDGEGSKDASAKLLEACKEALDVDLTGTEWEADWIKNGRICGCDACTLAREVVKNADILVKKSIWVFGGDGWAYDIGFGGLDHVIASGQDVNIFVFDTEVYSNTGGQASKASQIGQVAQFAAAGKVQAKKSLSEIAMTYGNVYVAQVAMGANMNQTVKAIADAEAYPGPSIVIGYSPCINHGLKNGMGKAMDETKAAVEAGYWHNFRYDPRLRGVEGKDAFQLDSKEPTASYKDFIRGEVRYSSLERSFPEKAAELFELAEQTAAEQYKKLERMKELYK
ncbi:MAG: pyruvate:ferredoxin (flavodoxin) oxidoreductase [Oscillospiraceae bacterium]|jgi:pyruvate-ferredoxin/flavodoxin oxidoreductase|nr:pyruvate:ferredoxin (flavodoxin) oxidoreductase [Oscillospiraceae bacterium]